MLKQTVAVVGASTDPTKYGAKAVKAFVRDGWDVHPIHPSAEHLDGLRCYRRLTEVPERLNRVTLYLPPEKGLAVLDDIVAVQPDEFYVNPGAESDELLARAKALGLEPIVACSILAIGQQPD